MRFTLTMWDVKKSILEQIADYLTSFTLTMWDVKLNITREMLAQLSPFYLNYVGCKEDCISNCTFYTSYSFYLNYVGCKGDLENL